MKKEKAIYIGEPLKRLRIAAGMSQEEFAYCSKLDRSYMSDLETNKKSPSLMTLTKLAGGLGISYLDFSAELGKTIDFARIFEEEPYKD
ncbi:helix-turn-helix domain-containing protein [Neobacillus sp. MER 74]|uniref:helix-turn-helix domain-containing protein n=1 Tax=Neobacillus sp. MER 74 TaxID=2939566 RepID=UPI00203C7A30|nr:helix-turn-helix transcriptional regulator [Neobacillus sp. MER 74]MCM3118449.1 helix-turn-helix domain-containing protein [Neobacillus sp. MER 74]